MRPYYADDLVTIYHGDCREIDAWLAADVMVTDPPYGIGWTQGENKAAKSAAHAGIANDEDTTARDDALSLWGGRPAILFGSWYAPFPPSLRQVLVWPKPADAGVVGSVTGFRRDSEPVFLTGEWPQRTVEWSSVLPVGATSIAACTRATGHPHTKPVPLLRTLIERCPAGVIVDPFMGSGSTLRAAKDLGRRAIGVEIDERYCEVAVRRLAQEALDLGGAA